MIQFDDIMFFRCVCKKPPRKKRQSFEADILKQGRSRWSKTKVLPLVDEDGVVVDASMPAYPWLGRNITAPW